MSARKARSTKSTRAVTAPSPSEPLAPPPTAAVSNTPERAERPAGPPGRPPTPEDVADGLRFVHLVEAQTKARIAQLAATVNAVVETLIDAGQLPREGYENRRRLHLVHESERAANEIPIELSEVDDKYALAELPQIDCAARLPLCKARCCTLTFGLSVQDLDERVVRWNYARPYRIAQREDGYCVHNDATRGCSVYEQRPATCRAYDCREDRRIWIDFEARVPAP